MPDPSTTHHFDAAVAGSASPPPPPLPSLPFPPQHPSSNGPPHKPAGAGGADLAAALEPALIAACEGRLSPIEWFRSTWQSSGAATGYSTYRGDDGCVHPVVVKLPVGPAEFAWTTAAAQAAAFDDQTNHRHHRPTLHVHASGTELGGYDLAWLVLERLPGHVLNHDLTESGVLDLLRAAARWYLMSSAIRPVGPPPATPDWGELLHKAREAVKQSEGRHGTHVIQESQRWNQAIKHVQNVLPRLDARWSSRPINAWCHGDLHPGNAMWRVGAGGASSEDAAPTEPPPPSCVLLDLALVHAGHWVEDAVYLERLYWGKPELLQGVKPVSMLSKFRKELGMHPAAGEDSAMLANVRRVLMAAAAPAFLHREGHPRYIHTALETIERLLPLVSK